MDDDLEIGEETVKGKSLWESEYGHIIRWCEKFWEISTGIHFSPTSEVSRRMKIFMFLSDKAKKKEELQDPFEYFDLKMDCPFCDGKGCPKCGDKGTIVKKANKYSRTFNEKQIGDYVNYLHQRVLDLKNQKIVPNYLRDGVDDD